MLFKKFNDNELKEIKIACKELQETVKRIRGEKSNRETKKRRYRFKRIIRGSRESL